METEKLTKYQRAQKKVADIRGFYKHLAVYLVINLTFFLLRDKMTVILLSKRLLGSPEVLETINWDVFGTPIVWGIGLALHGIVVFGNISLFGKKWEEKKMQEFLNENENNHKWR